MKSDGTWRLAIGQELGTPGCSAHPPPIETYVVVGIPTARYPASNAPKEWPTRPKVVDPLSQSLLDQAVCIQFTTSTASPYWGRFTCHGVCPEFHPRSGTATTKPQRARVAGSRNQL